jgi:hypothetical protein
VCVRVCHALKRGMGRSDIVHDDRNTTSASTVLPSELLRVDLRVTLCIWDAAKCILYGGFLMVYGTVILVACVTSTIVQYPLTALAMSLAASASAVCMLDW